MSQGQANMDFFLPDPLQGSLYLSLSLSSAIILDSDFHIFGSFPF